MGGELAVRELADQLDIVINQQQQLAIQGVSEDIQGTMFRQDQLIQGYIKLNRKIDPGIALALTIQSHLWDSLDDVTTLWSQSPWCPSTELDYSFEQYACRRTSRDWITLVNWIRTAELWLIDKVGPTGDVALVDPKTGQILLEQTNNETHPVMKRWDPFTVDFSKLLLMNKAAREEQLDDILWGLLINPASRWVDIKDALHGLLPWKRAPIDEPHQLSFFLRAGLLYVKKGELSEIVGNLEMNSDNSLVREGVARLIRTFGITIVI